MSSVEHNKPHSKTSTPSSNAQLIKLLQFTFKLCTFSPFFGVAYHTQFRLMHSLSPLSIYLSFEETFCFSFLCCVSGKFRTRTQEQVAKKQNPKQVNLLTAWWFMKCAGQQHEQQRQQQKKWYAMSGRKKKWMNEMDNPSKTCNAICFYWKRQESSTERGQKGISRSARKQNICDSNQSEPKDTQR